MDNQIIPISKNIVEPIIKSNIEYVDSIEEFEKIELELNQTILRFDNKKSVFYIRERNKYGEYSSITVYFYEDFAKHIQSDDNKSFHEKCTALKLDPLKKEIAYKFFIENEKPMKVWLWLLETKKSNMEYDSVKHLRYELKKQFLKLERKN